MIHTLILTTVALATLALGLVFGLLVISKRADKAMAEAIQNCTRPAPHVCKVNGPCNGWPKENQTFPAWIAEWEEKAKAEKEGRSMPL